MPPFLVLVLATTCPWSALEDDDDRAPWRPRIPRVWDPEAIESLEVPIPHHGFSPQHISAEFYEQIPVRPIYRSYPVYHPDYEPDGYWEWLEGQEPEIVFDPATLKTADDWIRAGELVFHEGNQYTSDGSEMKAVRNRDSYEAANIPLTKDGIFPFGRYFIRERGKVELGTDACAACHTRVLDNGTVIVGAQGNFPLGATVSYEIRKDLEENPHLRSIRLDESSSEYRRFALPWLEDDPNAAVLGMSLEDLASLWATFPAGVHPRERASYFFPTRIANLIGIESRRYLDVTGLFQHRSIGDLMRYAALNQGADDLSRFGPHAPGLVDGDHPDPSTLSRYSDAQLFALALYIYSLEPPESPFPYDEAAQRGERIFYKERCHKCHPAPDYTTHQLTPADDFEPTEDDLERFDIMMRRVSTDPSLTMKTRRGTGYYKIPSLRGLWYRGPFFHSGSLAQLEDVFDLRRLDDDYIPTGFHGAQAAPGPVLGHDYGLDLTEDERADLIAFLRTL